MAKKTDENSADQTQNIDAKKNEDSKKTTASKSTKKTRTERDLLGEMEVPNDVYYGVHTMRAIDNFQISWVTINNVPEFIRGMVMVKKQQPWPIAVCTRCPRRKLKLLSGPATRFWKKVAAWISSHWTCSRVERVLR